MRIVVLGNTGMIGRYCYTYFSSCKSLTNYNIVGYNRQHFDAREEKFLDIQKGDIVVNCVGILKPYINDVGIIDTIKINSIFPHNILEQCKQANARLIHICSDCVFSGAKGKYVETDICDATDIYARTKMLTPEEATVIRTSVIGEDLNADGVGFVQWMLSQKQVDGYNNCFWNGVTALQLAKTIEYIIAGNKLWAGVRHLFSKDFVSKYELCHYVSDIYERDIVINSATAGDISGTKINKILDRTLSTNYEPFDTGTIYDQISEMKEFKLV